MLRAPIPWAVLPCIAPAQPSILGRALYVRIETRRKTLRCSSAGSWLVRASWDRQAPAWRTPPPRVPPAPVHSGICCQGWQRTASPVFHQAKTTPTG